MLAIDVTRMDVLKMLLYAKGSSTSPNRPIRGKTRLQKEVFLAQKALSDKGIKRKYAFMPYYYGPFSRQLYFDINLLKKQGFVKDSLRFEDERGAYREFGLTDKGVAEVEKMLENPEINDIYQIVNRVRRDYDDMQLKDLVDLTHREYPEYVRDTNHRY